MKTLFFTFLSFVSFYGHAQKAIAKEIKNEAINSFAASMGTFETYHLADNFVKTFIVFNAPGSAHKEGTDEVSQSLYVSLCNSDESPVCTTYMIEGFVNLHVEKVTEDKSSVSLIISYGDYGKKKSDTIVIPYKKN